MQRVTLANGGYDPGTGKLIYIDRNIPGGVPGTDLVAVNRTTHQEEIANAVEMSGLVLNPADNTQLFQAIQRLSFEQSVFIGGPATTTWTVPANVTQVEFEIWGAGGAGGGAQSGAAAGGGAAGEYIRGIATVTPGAVMNVTAGGASVGGLPGMPGVGGQASYFAGRTAQGGGSGFGANTGAVGAGDTCGSGTSIPGDLTSLGTPGEAGATQGSVWLGGAGGSASFGGAGGSAGFGPGQLGQFPGGGGAGGGPGQQGGSGASGLVVIRWNAAPP